MMRELWILTAAECCLSAAGAWILFQNPRVCLCAAAVLLPFLYLRTRRMLRRRFERKLEKQFCAALVRISGSLTSGMRLEHCIAELAEETSAEYDVIRPEFVRMRKLIQLKWTPERAFADFAGRYENPDIRMFSNALQTGIPAGVNLVELVRNIAATLRMKCDVEAEIEKTLNLPKYNNRVILVMPFLTTLLVRQMAGSYAAMLDTGAGRIVMPIAAVLLVAAFVLGDLLGTVRY